MTVMANVLHKLYVLRLLVLISIQNGFFWNNISFRLTNLNVAQIMKRNVKPPL